MTKREVLSVIMNANLSEEVNAYCEKEIASIDKSNSARAIKAQAKAEAEAPIYQAITSFVREAGSPVTASQVFESVEGLGSVQKASSVLRKLKEAGTIQQGEVRIKGRAVKVYSI